MEFQIGNIVKIRDGLVVGTYYGKLLFTEEMKKYKGKHAKIIQDSINFNDCKLDVDNEEWYWNP